MKDVAKLAQEHGRTSAQVLLKWAVDQGVVVIPGATSHDHIKENLNLEGFDIAFSALGPTQDQSTELTGESAVEKVPHILRPRRALKGLPDVNNVERGSPQDESP